MGLRRHWRVKVWAVERKENYSMAEMSTSKKKEDGTYETDWSSKYVMLVGKAHEADVKPGDVVYVNDFEVTNRYDKEKKQLFTNYKIIAFEDRNGAKKEEKKEESVVNNDAEDLPFD